MNNKTLDQKRCIDSNKIINTTTKLQRKNQISIPKESIYERLKVLLSLFRIFVGLTVVIFAINSVI